MTGGVSPRTPLTRSPYQPRRTDYSMINTDRNLSLLRYVRERVFSVILEIQNSLNKLETHCS